MPKILAVHTMEMAGECQKMVSEMCTKLEAEWTERKMTAGSKLDQDRWRRMAASWWNGRQEDKWEEMEQMVTTELGKNAEEGRGNEEVKTTMAMWRTEMQMQGGSQREKFQGLMKQVWNKPCRWMWTWVKPMRDVTTVQRMTATIGGRQKTAQGTD